MVDEKADITDEYGRKVGELRERSFGRAEVFSSSGDRLASANRSGSGYDIVDEYGQTRGSLRPRSDVGDVAGWFGLAGVVVAATLAVTAVLWWLTWRWYKLLIWSGPRWVHRTIRDDRPRKKLAYVAAVGYGYIAVATAVGGLLALL